MDKRPNSPKVSRSKPAESTNWLGLSRIVEVLQLSRMLKPRLASLEKTFDSRLKQEGFNKAEREALAKISPLAAVRLLGGRSTDIHRFFASLSAAGQQLARLNVAPGQITGALHICNQVIATAAGKEFAEAREQLGYSTILALNQAYYDVREAEAKTFYNLFQIELQSSNVDFLYRRFIESMAESCGAAAGHLFVAGDDGRHWQLKASTAQAASPRTLAVVPVKASSRRALMKPMRVRTPELILDAGWRGVYKSIWSIPLDQGGIVQYAFAADRELLPRELEMLGAAGDRCYAAAQKTRLLEDVALREEQLSKLAIRMLMVEENERRRISRELHDDAGQSLVVIRLQMEMIEQALPEGSEERDRLSEARDITEKTILDIRRLISDLSPAVLEQLGLGAALRQLVKRFSMRYPCRISLDDGPLPQMDTNFQLVIYRLAQECFDNIAQHSEATAVNISISAADNVLRLRVEDNGIGFHVEETLERKDCFGLAGLRERVTVLGGSVSIFSTRKEGQKRGARKKNGTVIGIELPIP